MENIINIVWRTPIFQLFLFIGIIGFLILGISFFFYKKTPYQKELDDKLCRLFYEQHLFLFLHKKDFFAYEKVKELLFLQKNKLFQKSCSKKNKEKYYTLATIDLQCAKDLIKKQTKQNMEK